MISVQKVQMTVTDNEVILGATHYPIFNISSHKVTQKYKWKSNDNLVYLIAFILALILGISIAYYFNWWHWLVLVGGFICFAMLSQFIESLEVFGEHVHDHDVLNIRLNSGDTTYYYSNSGDVLKMQKELVKAINEYKDNRI